MNDSPLSPMLTSRPALRLGVRPASMLWCFENSMKAKPMPTSFCPRHRRTVQGGLYSILFAAALAGASVDLLGAPAARWIVCGSASNDFLVVMRENGMSCARTDLPEEAVAAAPEGGAVLVLADGYPSKTTQLEAGWFERAAAKRLRLYVEYPGALPGMEVGPPRQTEWERAVISSDAFVPALPRLRILSPQDCYFVPVTAEKCHMVLARVAGYNNALYGLPQKTFPLLFELAPAAGRGPVLVATTKLSQALTARYAPSGAWRAVWSGILSWLAGGRPPPELRWTPTVRPTFAQNDPLPADAAAQALQRGVEWFINSKLLLPASRLGELTERAAVGSAPAPPPAAPIGDGSLGILEGYLSRIQPDGRQLQTIARRGDCTAESAMALAFGGKVQGRSDYANIARNLLDFYYFSSPARKGERGDPKHGAYGLVAWGIDTPAWRVANYGDDNARLLLGTMAAAALLGEERWDEAMLLCLLANLRTTGPLGFRGDRIDIGDLSAHGWEHFFRRRITNYAPHYESYLWACYLWAYRQTGFELFRERAKIGIRRTMAAYPGRWRWTNGMQQERARMLLPLAWLVRLEDTAEHRGWLRRIADDLLAAQDASGALREEIGALSQGQMHPPQSNDAYGTGETPLLQQNGDPVSDLLYTSNFAFLGLHEAAAATAEPFYAAAAQKLAQFLCRIQIRSDRHRELDGGWYRGFDFRRWEYWASNADAGWGVWSIESGWTQGWITSVLALRQLNTSLWELTRDNHLKRHLDRLRPMMIPDQTLAAPETARVAHAAVGQTVTLSSDFSPNYPGDGAAGLVDGYLAGLEHVDPGWLGFWGQDLVATIDLGEPVEVKGCSARFLQNVRLGIFLPTALEIFTGTELGELTRQRTVNSDVPVREPGPLTGVLGARDLSVRARFVQIRAKNIAAIPSWHPAAGQKAWLFADEVLVNPVQEVK